MKSGNAPQSAFSMPGSSARVPDMMRELLRRTPQRFPPRRWPDAIRVTARFSAAPERIFAAWLDGKVAGRWLFATASRPMTDVEIDPRVGGSFRLANRLDREVDEYRGRFIEIVPARRLVFNLAANGLALGTRVTIEIVPLKNGSCLKLTHENVPRDRRNYLQQRWTGILYGLGVALADPKFPL
jgi:uncharacterized protein YndB with AHSA1/START domain